MYVLDTDHISLIQRAGREGQNIVDRLSAENVEQLKVSVITYEEQVRGRLANLSRARSLDQRVLAYHQLYRLSVDYQFVTVIPFTKNIGLRYQQLRKAYPRLGSMDLRIAATVIENQATLLTRNVSDFKRTEGLKQEDWSI